MSKWLIDTYNYTYNSNSNYNYLLIYLPQNDDRFYHSMAGPSSRTCWNSALWLGFRQGTWQNQGISPRKIVISWFLTKKKCDLVVFNQEKLWFSGF